MSKLNPLVIDVDGTLIHNDLTHELLLLGFCSSPLKGLTYVKEGLRSKNGLKEMLVSSIGDKIDVTNLPYNETIIDFAKAEAQRGREIVLCSGSHEFLIDKIADHFDWVDAAYATNADVNLTSKNKAAFLTEKYPDGFDYIGNSTQDYEVWKVADKAYSVEAPAGSQSIRTASGGSVEPLVEKKTSIKPLLKAMRLHQWAKNVLLFLVPVLVIDTLGVTDILPLILGFIGMGLLASGTYLFNDALDIQNDRSSASKRKRPFASGKLGLTTGIGLFIACLLGALIISLILPTLYFVVLMIYFVTTMTYSVVLKRLVVIDVMTLAFLFLVRVLAGAAIIGVSVSPWLVSFILTFFLSLSLTKRYTELVKLNEKGRNSMGGRGYDVRDIPLVLGFGMMATATSILSFILYGLVAEQPVLASDISIFIVGFLLVYWMLRLWYLAHRGILDDDPVLFAVKDKLSIAIGGLIFLVVLAEEFKFF
ncbi:MAG: UbiA family prenyltransferase [Litorimonas sp.]